MKKVFLCLGMVLLGLVLISSFLILRVPSLPSNHGKLDTRLFLGDSTSQALVVAFGGGEGGNDWERHYLKDKRDEFLARGFAVLAIGYFNTAQSPNSLDRISLNALSDTILAIAKRHPELDTTRIILMGASKGGELVLNLASRFPHFKGVVALSTSHVSFPALTISANTSSWQFNGLEVPYVPAPLSVIWPALQGDLYTAFSLMLEDEKAVTQAEIEVEKINGPILLLSGTQDDQWPATFMSEQIVVRLAKNNFPHSFQHLALAGGHIQPLNHFDKVFDFLEKEFKE
jgi:pimeloyl-ACP methyl ester carboxylesterase